MIIVFLRELLYKDSLQNLRVMYPRVNYRFPVGICGVLTGQLESKAAAVFLLELKLVYISTFEEFS